MSRALVFEKAVTSRARTTFLVSVVVTFALFVIPYGDYLAYPLLLISTLVHELGHGIAAVLVGGEFAEFRMYADGSGVAMTRVAGDGASAFVSMGGLIGPPVVAAVFFWLGRNRKLARYALGGFGALLALAILLVVRNGFGIAFTGALAAACIVIASRASDELAQISLVFLAVQLALSVYSRGDYLFTEYAQTGQGAMPSDVKHMEMALALPYWFWGAVCAAISVAALLIGAFSLLRGPRLPGKVKKI